MEIDDSTIARVFSFDEHLKGSEKTRFYRKLYGYRSVIKGKLYHYSGLADEIVCFYLGKSIIATPNYFTEKLRKFFRDWSKVSVIEFDAILPNQERWNAIDKYVLGLKIEFLSGTSILINEIENLLELLSSGRENLGPSEEEKAVIVVKAVKEIVQYDWTDGKEYSKKILERIQPITSLISK